MDFEYLNASVLENFVPAIRGILVQAVVSAANSFAWTLLMANSLSQGSHVLEMQHNEFGGYPLSELFSVKKPYPENQDGSDTDGGDEEDEEEVEEQDKDGNVSGDEAGLEEDSEDEAEANGDGGSEEEDDDSNDEDGNDDYEEDGEEEEEEEEEIPQPPAKKRK